MAVLGGLASTGKAPNSPASALPAPTPTKSRSTSGVSPGAPGKEREVAAVCTMIMTEMIAARPITCVRSSSEGVGMAGCGGANVEGADDRDASRFEIEMRDDESRAASAISAPGMRGLIFSNRTMHGETG